MKTPKKIVIVASYAPSLLNFRKELLSLLKEKQYDVIVLAPDFQLYPDAAEELKKMNVRCKIIHLSRNGINPFSDLRTILSIGAVIKEEEPEIVLAYTIKPVIWSGIALLVCKKYSVRYVVLITGLGYVYTNPSFIALLVQKLLKPFYQLSLHRAESVIFQNLDDRNLFVQKKMADKHKVHVVNGSGVNTDIFSYTPCTPCNNPIKLILIARLIKDKGVFEYVEAAKRVKLAYPNAEFHLVGPLDSNPTSVSQQELDGWIKEGTVIYHGELKDVRNSLINSHVYVLPSYREGTPRTILEAMSTGRAIITTDTPGCRQTVENGRNGFLVPLKSVDALVDKITFFIEHPDAIERMGLESRKMVIDRYCVRKVNSQMLDIMGIKS